MIIIHAQLYEEFSINPTIDKVPLTKLDYVYFSIITWTTVGYGDFVPSAAERPIAAEEALFGFIYMGAYIGYTINALSVLSKYDYSKILSDDKPGEAKRASQGEPKEPPKP
ncbi:potassium channel family protein [Bradyrhizobium sp. Cp5.3]|uniref:potassium channel family protein n=1 Tax=Bradyrhizobium sp. Cp5.3 TaxID=443598 RepID=UPI00040277B5|nr:potassium channel family protein [Bradyrhizobium sp. Cp5.3]